MGNPLKMKTPSKKSESQVVTACRKYLKDNGWTPITLFTGGIPIGNGRYAENPAKGIPDSMNFHNSGRILWIEYKSSTGGIISDDQRIWHNSLRRGGYEVIVIHSLDALKMYLNSESWEPS